MQQVAQAPTHGALADTAGGVAAADDATLGRAFLDAWETHVMPLAIVRPAPPLGIYDGDVAIFGCKRYRQTHADELNTLGLASSWYLVDDSTE